MLLLLFKEGGSLLRATYGGASLFIACSPWIWVNWNGFCYHCLREMSVVHFAYLWLIHDLFEIQKSGDFVAMPSSNKHSCFHSPLHYCTESVSTDLIGLKYFSSYIEIQIKLHSLIQVMWKLPNRTFSHFFCIVKTILQSKQLLTTCRRLSR